MKAYGSGASDINPGGSDASAMAEVIAPRLISPLTLTAEGMGVATLILSLCLLAAVIFAVREVDKVIAVTTDGILLPVMQLQHSDPRAVAAQSALAAGAEPAPTRQTSDAVAHAQASQ
ncbi:MAG: hypothetical protein EPN79_11045 [Burkholderiaceae bacterium]|nr:MAG: hypothetical protein EPN79_11045 [Burkholderiaceae bacterium]TBR76780.1 MAG: hypothetical protein EPN64_06030 [Burkholderiaceae bacterium]